MNKLTPREPTPEIHNPWRRSLENCISGDNYLRAQEYLDLIEELDDLYRLRAYVDADRAQREPTEAEIKQMALKTIAEIGQEIERAVLLPKKPPFIGGIQEGLPERQWLMSVKDLEEYVAQDRARRVPLVSGDPLWLWRDGDRLLAYRHEYPCYSPGGDPMTLGEPVCRAEFRESHDRSSGIGAKP